jgi:2-polyprenyl-3-methyl-5-hydroxy-6-metoxy-1,4-benzoquinol methylase
LGIETMSIDLNGDWEQLSGRRFDVVVAGEILEHLYFPKHILAKIASVLEPGGMLIGSVPNAFSLKNRVRYALGRKEDTPLADPTHINHFSVPELQALLKEHFKDVTIIGLGRYTRLARLNPQHFAFDLVFIARL